MSPQKRWRFQCFKHSMWSPQLQRACSVFFFSVLVISSLSSPKLSLAAEPSHTGVKMWPSGSCRLCCTEVLISASPTPLQDFNTNWCDWTSTVKETQTSVVYCTYELLLPLYELLVLSVLMTSMFTWNTKYQGLEQDYLNMMPLKHAIAFIYDVLFLFLLFFCFCFFKIFICLI